MEENKCGDCFWFTKTASVYNIGYNIYDHYCKLHFTEELRHKNEKACMDFKERDSDGKEND
jgi:hypothetical protein